MELKDYMVENVTVEELKELVEACNNSNDSLDHLRVYINDEDFFSMMYDGDVMGAIRAISFGDYTYNDDYVMFNGYGNLDTLSDYAYYGLLKDSESEIIEAAIDNLAEAEIMDILDIDDSDLEEEEEEA